MSVLLPFVAVLGLVVGSFLNVVAHRVPRGESVVSPGSYCPHCGHPVRGRHNVPVLGWLALRGRCADCRAPISPRYPVVELLTGALFAALAARLGALHLLSALPAYLYFAAAGIALSLIDLECRRLPSVLVLPAYPVLAALLAASAGWQHAWWPLARAVLGGAVLFAFYWALAFAYPAGMGYGDVRLSGVLGGMLGYLSWSALVVGAFGGFLLGGVVGVAMMAAGRGGRKSALPFGPFMIAGALAAVFAAAPLAGEYLRLLGHG